MSDGGLCGFPDCGRKLFSRGYCASHSKQLRAGAPIQKLLTDLTYEERFWGKVDMGTPESCWVWTGAKTSGGYGSWGKPGERKILKAHRVSFELHYGFTPDQVDHTCRNRICVNPNHLASVTKQENNENVTLRTDNTSGYRGVSFHKPTGKWHASASYKGRIQYLGLHDTPEEAAQAAKEFRLDNHTNNLEDRNAAAL